MESYATQKSNYIAPYTSLITSSMMGKSRLMKQVAAHIPTVYICLRKPSSSYGYPKQTPILAKWFCESALGLADKHETKDYYFCFPTLKYALFLVFTIRRLVEWIQNHKLQNSLGKIVDNGSKFEFSWLWEFFAEPPNENDLGDFWKEVIDSVTEQFRYMATGKKAHKYFVNSFRNDIVMAMVSFKECLSLNNDVPTSLDLLFMYDEARVLCEVEALDGRPIFDESIRSDLAGSVTQPTFTK